MMKRILKNKLKEIRTGCRDTTAKARGCWESVS